MTDRGIVRFSGTLTPPGAPAVQGAAAALAEEPHPAPELVVAVQRIHAGEDVMDEVLRLFRRAQVWLEVTQSDDAGHVVTPVRAQGLIFLPLFSSETLLARFARASGRGGQRITFGTLTGAEVLDELLPELSQGTGLILDAVSDHVLALPRQHSTTAANAETETMGERRRGA